MSYSALLLDDDLAHVSSEGQWLTPRMSPRESRHRPPSMLDAVLSWPERSLALSSHRKVTSLWGLHVLACEMGWSEQGDPATHWEADPRRALVTQVPEWQAQPGCTDLEVSRGSQGASRCPAATLSLPTCP